MTCKLEWGGGTPLGKGCLLLQQPQSLTRVCPCASRSFNVNLRAVIQVSQVCWLQGRTGNYWVMPALPHPSAISDCRPRPDSSGSPRGHRECF